MITHVMRNRWPLSRHQWLLALVLAGTGIFAWPVTGGDSVRSIHLEQLATIHGPWKSLRAIAFASNGKTFATGGFDGRIRIWDVQTCKERLVLKGNKAAGIYCLAFSGDGAHLAAGTVIIESQEEWREEVNVWRIQDRTIVATWKLAAGAIRSVQFSPDSKFIAIGFDAHRGHISLDKVGLWEFRADKMTVPGENNNEYYSSPVFSPRGDSLYGICAFGESGVISWALPGCRERFRLTSPDYLSFQHLAVSHDGKTLIAGGQNAISLLSSENGRLMASVPTTQACGAMALSAKGTLLATEHAFAASEPNPESQASTIRLWSFEPKLHALASESWPATELVALAISPDGKLIAAIGNTDLLLHQDSVIKLWKIKESK